MRLTPLLCLLAGAPAVYLGGCASSSGPPLPEKFEQVSELQSIACRFVAVSSSIKMHGASQKHDAYLTRVRARACVRVFRCVRVFDALTIPGPRRGDPAQLGRVFNLSRICSQPKVSFHLFI